MKRSCTALLLLTLAPALGAQDACESDLDALHALYEIRQVALKPASSSYEMSRTIDSRMDQLRGPLPDGGYRWVRFVRPSAESPVVKREHLASGDEPSRQLDSFEASADHPFAVRVAVPRKRGLFKANKEVFVGTVQIRYQRDGREREITRDINQWMSPDTSRSFDLGGIADEATVSVESASRPNARRESMVEIHFLQAVAQDDPSNPNYETLQTLSRLRQRPEPDAIDVEIGRLERRSFPTLAPVPITTLITRLREADLLMRSSKPEDQEKGRKLLEQVMILLPR